MEAFNVLGLNEDFEIIEIIRFINLQWTRKYHESGWFSVQIPVNQYMPEMKYIYTKDRPEMGVIKKVTYVSVTGREYIQLSGTFLEAELNRMCVYPKCGPAPKGETNITTDPGWEFRDGAAEDVALAYYEGFRRIGTAQRVVELDIESEASLHRGNYSIHYRNGEDLDYKLYDILKPSGMSYSVHYDLNANTKTMKVWQGLDRTQDNEDGNNPIIFSTRYGNINKPNIVIDETDYKNACIVSHGTATTSDMVTEMVFNEDDDPTRILYYTSLLNRSDYKNQAEFIADLKNEGLNALEENEKIINVEFDTMAGSYIYGEDFDIGDVCSLEIPAMHLAADVRLIGCYEVMKDGRWTMTMEFGTPILIK